MKAYFIIVTMDKVWLCEYVGKLKGVGKQAKKKMNELSIHTIDDIQIRAHHHGTPKVHIGGFGQIFDIALQALPGNPPPSFKYHKKAKNTYILRYGEIWVEKTEVFYCNVKIPCKL